MLHHEKKNPYLWHNDYEQCSLYAAKGTHCRKRVRGRMYHLLLKLLQFLSTSVALVGPMLQLNSMTALDDMVKYFN